MSKVVILTKNLMDASKVQALLPGAKVARSLDSETLAEADLVLLDLESGVDPSGAAAVGPPVIAYGPHVNAAGLEAAVAAGCSEALPRSQLFARLPKFETWTG